MTVGSCMYSHIGSYIESMYIGSSSKLIRMTVGSSMHSNFGSFISLFRSLSLSLSLPLSLSPSIPHHPPFSAPLSLCVPSLSLYISLYIYPMSFYLSLSLSLSRISIEHLSKIYPAASPILSFLSRSRLISPFYLPFSIVQNIWHVSCTSCVGS